MSSLPLHSSAAVAAPAPQGLSQLWLGLAVVIVLGAFPWVAPAIGLEYYVGWVRRLMMISLAVISLNFLIGTVGLVALGHAAFVGVGAYVVAIASEAGWVSAPAMWLVAIVGGVAVSALIGLVSLRTKGVYFIMITLAFAQMLYYLAISLRKYGGEDGYTLYTPLVLWGGEATIPASGTPLYLAALLCVVLVMGLLARVQTSRFGKALEGIRDNETRMQAMGYPTLALKLCAFAAAGGVASLSGALIATQNAFVSPSLMHWSQSALLIVMVVIGGVGRRWGAPLGVVVWLLCEEVLSQHTEYWHAPMGLMLIAVVFLAPQGIAALRTRKAQA